MRAISRWLLLSVFLSTGSVALAQEEHAYTEGEVVNVGYVRTKYGMFDEYMKFLDGPYKRLMEDAKKGGTITDWSVYQAFPRNPHEPDIILVTRFRNMAALDGLTERMDALERKVFGTMDASNKAAVDREKVREVLGGQLLRELKLK